MNRPERERLVRDLRTIATRMPNNQMGATERRFVSDKILALCDVEQQRLDDPRSTED